MLTYNNLVDIFTLFVDNHLILKSFSHGGADDIDLSKDPSYPLMHLLYTGSDYEGGNEAGASSKVYNLEVYFLDQPTDKLNKTDHQKEVISDLEQCAEDLVADIRGGFNVFKRSDNFEVRSFSVVPLEEEESNVLSGVLLSISLSVPYLNSSCSIPLTTATFTSVVCESATVKNSDDTYTNTVNSGGSLTLPDVTVTDVNGTTRTEASVKDITCAFSSILVKDSAGNTLTNISSYPVGGEVTLAGSGIVYEPQHPTANFSMITGDSWYNFTSGNYDRTIPALPSSYATIKRNATQADVRATPATGTSGTDAVTPTILEENNAFGNKFRYTDDQGNASNATVGSNLMAHVDWVNHNWASAGSTAYYVIDHLTGFGYTVQYEDDGGIYNLQNTANGQTWEDWIAYINGTHHGYTGWMPLDCGEVMNAHGACAQPQLTWADNFFKFQALAGSTRGAFLTGETSSIVNTGFLLIFDTGNLDLIRSCTKAKDGSFFNRIANCFMKRKHY